MDVDVDDEEIREKIKQRMRENGSMELLEQKFRCGLIQAIDAIEGNDDDTNIDHRPFADKSAREIQALQIIYHFLDNAGLKHTRVCLGMETNVPSLEEEEMDIRTLLGEIPKDPIVVKQEIAPPVAKQEIAPILVKREVVPPVEITKREFQQNAVILLVDEL
jgi:hypothetical protein